MENLPPQDQPEDAHEWLVREAAAETGTPDPELLELLQAREDLIDKVADSGGVRHTRSELLWELDQTISSVSKLKKKLRGNSQP